MARRKKVEYVYKCRLADVETWPSFRDGAKDGDSMRFIVDQGFRDYPQKTFRIKDLNTAELNSKNPEEVVHAKKAQALAKRLLKNKDVIIQTFLEPGPYNRYSAVITLPDGTDFAETMRKAGMEKREIY